MRGRGDEALRHIMRLDRPNLPDKSEEEMEEIFKEVAEVCHVDALT